MTPVMRHVLVLVFPLIAGCQGADPGHDAHPPAPAALAAPEPARPMPPAEERIARLLAELGPEASTLQEPLRMQGDALALPRRDAMAALSPRVRAAMVRHNVRAEELARHLAAGGGL